MITGQKHNEIYVSAFKFVIISIVKNKRSLTVEINVDSTLRRPVSGNSSFIQRLVPGWMYFIVSYEHVKHYQKPKFD